MTLNKEKKNLNHTINTLKGRSFLSEKSVKSPDVYL